MANNSMPALPLPRTRSCPTFFKGRKIHKAFADIKITLLCGLMTFVVLRSCLEGGRFRSPMDDFEDIQRGRRHLYHALVDVQERMSDSVKSTINDKENIQLGSKAEHSEQTGNLKLEHSSPNSCEKSNPRILLVTGSQPAACPNADGYHFLLLSAKNKIDYCRLHGIEIMYNTANLERQKAGIWAKLPIIRELMMSPESKAEWIWWMDSDALFTNMSIGLPMERYTDYNMVLLGSVVEEPMYKETNWTGLQDLGSLLIRNCEWSLNLLESWAAMVRNGESREGLILQEIEGEVDDRWALEYLLVSEAFKWRNKVFLESSKSLHNKWVINEDMKELGVMESYREESRVDDFDQRWAMITHFEKCKPCTDRSSSTVLAEAPSALRQGCMHQMQRALNCADNQARKLYD